MKARFRYLCFNYWLKLIPGIDLGPYDVSPDTVRDAYLTMYKSISDIFAGARCQWYFTVYFCIFIYIIVHVSILTSLLAHNQRQAFAKTYLLVWYT